MATVANLVFEMSANVARLQSDMAKAHSTVASTMDGIKGAAGMAAKALGALGVGLSVSAFADMIHQSIDAMDALHKLALRTGNTVESLSSLRPVARAAGADMDEIAKAAQKLSKNMLEVADTGKGKAAAAFADLGIQVVDADGKLRNNIEVMQELAGKLSTMEDRTRAVAYAQIFFSKAGANLLPFLQQLSEAGELHAGVTTKQAEEAHKFHEQLALMTGRSDALKRSMAVGLLPALLDITGAFNHLNERAADFHGFFESVGTVMQWAAAIAYGFWSTLKLIGETLGASIAVWDRLMNFDFKGAAAAAREGAGEISRAAAEAGYAIQLLTGQVSLSKPPAATRGGSGASSSEGGVSAGTTTSSRTPAQQARETADEVIRWNGALDDQVAKNELVAASQQKIAVAVDNTNKQLADTTKKNDDVQKSFETAAERAVKNYNNLREVLQQLLADLARAAVRAVSPGTTVTDVVKSSGIGDYIAGLFGGAHADGGSMPANTWNLVGEQGPELVWSGAGGGNVIPNGALGGGDTFYVDMRGTDPRIVAKFQAYVDARMGQVVPTVRNWLNTYGVATPGG